MKSCIVSSLGKLATKDHTEGKLIISKDKESFTRLYVNDQVQDFFIIDDKLLGVIPKIKNTRNNPNFYTNIVIGNYDHYD